MVLNFHLYREGNIRMSMCYGFTLGTILFKPENGILANTTLVKFNGNMYGISRRILVEHLSGEPLGITVTQFGDIERNKCIEVILLFCLVCSSHYVISHSRLRFKQHFHTLTFSYVSLNREIK